jgi:hypothetical protein
VNVELCSSSQQVEEWKNKHCELIQSLMVDFGKEEKTEDCETLQLQEASRRFSVALQQYLKSRKDAFGALVHKQD